jgi:hypothetical protein
MGKKEEEEIGLHSFSKYCRITRCSPNHHLTFPKYSKLLHTKNIATFGRLFWTTYRVLGYMSV